MARIALLPGDGIGIEVIAEAEKVLRLVDTRFQLGLTFETLPYGADHTIRTGETVPEGFCEDWARRFDAVLLGALGDPRLPDNRHIRDILLGARFGLDLYINLRPVQLLREDLCPIKGKRIEDVDFVVYRENTEGLYCGLGGFFKQGTPDEVAINEDLNTRRGVERIIRAAFEGARTRPRRKLTLVDKSNALKYAHGLWQRVFADVSQEYPDVEKDHLYVDVAAMEMVRHPERFDVVVTCNLFGDILSDLAAALVGGLGLSPSANFHPGRCSMFEPVHGSAPDIVGQGKANPFAAILTAALLLDHVGHPEAARAIESAVTTCVREGLTTSDIGGALSTTGAGDAVCGLLEGAA